MAKNFCIYCGTPLTPGMECACRSGAPAPEIYAAPAPEAYAEPAPVYAEPAPEAEVGTSKKYCIYCGAPLTPGVECACRSAAPAPVYAEPAPEAYIPPAPEAYSEPTPAYAPAAAPSKFCIRCGKPLAPGEACLCESAVSAPAPSAPTYEIPAPGAVAGGIKTTMRTSDKPSKPPAAPSPFLNKPSDLD